jgi:hypothetical protein
MRPSRPRKTADLSQPLSRRLNMYALAAAAAGAGMLTLAVSAEGKIVYTKTDQQIPPNFGIPPFYLDVNNDGINDFSFINFFSSTSSTLNLTVAPVDKSNEIFSTGAGSAAALRAGVRVGPNRRFQQRLGEGMASGDSHGTCRGPWIDAHRRYLGLKFIIKGKVHFGWARLNVTCVFPKAINATLTGYAYETVANKPIVTGKTKGPDVNVEPATLGQLARGAASISSWRVKQPAEAIH